MQFGMRSFNKKYFQIGFTKTRSFSNREQFKDEEQGKPWNEYNWRRDIVSVYNCIYVILRTFI